MPPRPRPPAVYRDAAFLACCSESEACDWLSARPTTYSTVMGTPNTPPDSHLFEQILLRRNRPRIDLALAEHGRSRSVLTRVYKRAPLSVRVAACRNPSLFVGDLHAMRGKEAPHLLWHIVQHGSLPELRAVCENPDLPSEFYLSLLESWEGDPDKRIDREYRLGDDRFRDVVRFLAHNPRISTPREESKERYYMDGYSDYRYSKFFTKCWELATLVPVTSQWAEALTDLYSKLVKSQADYKDVPAVLERWRQADETEYSPMLSLRKAIAVRQLAPTLAALQSPDPALRAAFYSSCDPDDPSVAALDWTEWLAVDKYCFWDLSDNLKIWRSPRGRAKLRDLLWHKARGNSDLTDVGFFDARAAEYRVSNPEWFTTETESRWDDVDPPPHDAPPAQMTLSSLDHSGMPGRGGVAPTWIAVAAFLGALLGAALF